ncbi:acyl carrier protein [Pinisolibacter sp.]|uniref:acyl carrier protein n=1 Tax=Pinisolibacter sp. TaxID=2172024 RepID=UPI002FDE9588
MSNTATAATVRESDGQLSALDRRIIEFIQKEIQDKSVVLTRETRREDVAIDSIDVVNVVFAIEEEFDIEVNLTPDAKFDTVGELIDTLIGFIPEEKRAS